MSEVAKTPFDELDDASAKLLPSVLPDVPILRDPFNRLSKKPRVEIPDEEHVVLVTNEQPVQADASFHEPLKTLSVRKPSNPLMSRTSQKEVGGGWPLDSQSQDDPTKAAAPLDAGIFAVAASEPAVPVQQPAAAEEATEESEAGVSDSEDSGDDEQSTSSSGDVGPAAFDVDEVLANAAAPTDGFITMNLKTFDDSEDSEGAQKKPAGSRRPKAPEGTALSPFAAPPAAAARRRPQTATLSASAGAPSSSPFTDSAPSASSSSPFDAFPATFFPLASTGDTPGDNTAATAAAPAATPLFPAASEAKTPEAFAKSSALFPEFEVATPPATPGPATTHAKGISNQPTLLSESGQLSVSGTTKVPPAAAPTEPAKTEATPLVMNPARLSRDAIKSAVNIRKGKRLPEFPEEATASEKGLYDRSWRLSEIMAQAIVLLDVRRVRLLLQSGLNPDGKVEFSHEKNPRMLSLVNTAWVASLKAASEEGDTFTSKFEHSFGTSQRKSTVAEIVAIAKLILLRGPKLTDDVVASITVPELRILVENFPQTEDVAGIVTNKKFKRSEEEVFFGNKLKQARAQAERASLRDTPANQSAAEKERKKAYKKIPKNVVKKFASARISPELSEDLRLEEKLYLTCSLGDIIGLYIMINSGVDVNAVIECWDEFQSPLRPLEVIAIHCPKGDAPETKQKRASFVKYSRVASRDSYIECAMALLGSGAEVTSLAMTAVEQNPALKEVLHQRKDKKKEKKVKGTLRMKGGKKDKQSKK